MMRIIEFLNDIIELLPEGLMNTLGVIVIFTSPIWLLWLLHCWVRDVPFQSAARSIAKRERKKLIKAGMDKRRLVILENELFILDEPLKPGEEKDLIVVRGKLMRKQDLQNPKPTTSRKSPPILEKEPLDTPEELEWKRGLLIKTGIDENSLIVVDGILYIKQNQGDAVVLLEATLDAPNYQEAEETRKSLIEAGLEEKSLVIVDGRLYQKQNHGDTAILGLIH